MNDYKVVENKFNTIVSALLDKSGSMASVKRDTIDGFNEYLSTLQSSETADDTGFRLTQFDSISIERTELCPVKNAKPLNNNTFVPRGGTPLYDAIGTEISNLSSLVGDASVVVIILTDGGENSSMEWNTDSVSKLVKEKEKDGWTFVFLGANQDSWAVSSLMGFSASNTRDFSTDDMRNTFRGIADSTVAYASNSTMVKSADPYAKYVSNDFFNEKKGE